MVCNPLSLAYQFHEKRKTMIQEERIKHLRKFVALPDNLTVGGSLYLSGTAITALPDNLTVGGSLDLSGTAITALPDNLTVGGSLDLRGTAITALPDNLTVGGYLYLSGTAIEGSQYDCGDEKRTIHAYHNSAGILVVSLGCFVGGLDECTTAILAKYGTGEKFDAYIKKVRAAFEYVEKK